MNPPERRHVLLIGLPGAGKTAAGRHLAEKLQSSFTDLDETIIGVMGRSVARIFLEQGEDGFRLLERELMLVALDRPPQVIAAGGGWAAGPGNLDTVEGRAMLVYLRVSPETAAARLGADRSRPLLGDEPLPQLRRLLREREVYYRTAEFEVDTEGLTPEQIADAVAGLARRHAGWGNRNHDE